MMNRKMISFVDENYWLSNFSEHSVTFDGIKYKSSEAAFQAQKTEEWERYRFSGLTARDAKKLGKKVKLRPDWEDVKDDLMYEICKAKLQQNHLESVLLETGDTELVETNTWHDNYWGVCTCGRCKDGRNQLGKTWMRMRNELKQLSGNG